MEQHGDLDEAVAGCRRAVSVSSGRADPDSVDGHAQAVKDLVEFEAKARLLAVARGQAEPRDQQEQSDAVTLASQRGEFLPAVRSREGEL